jgi:alpha-tubulin suppressor-like RCC1 family protein
LNDPVVRLAAGGFHTCHIRGDGTVRCWGDNRFGTVACWGAGGLLGKARRVSIIDADTHCAGVRPQTCT